MSKRPCKDRHPTPVPDECILCSRLSDKRFQQLWNEKPPQTPVKLKVAVRQADPKKIHLPCVHFDPQPVEPPGKRTGKDGKVCGCVSQWLYGCELHGKCVRSKSNARTGVACCDTCPDYSTEEEPELKKSTPAAEQTRLLLRHHRAPGDILAMTALVRDIHITYPGKYLTGIDTPCKDIWKNNPHVSEMRDKLGCRIVNLSYGESISRASRETIHFMTGFHHDFEKKTGIRVPLQLPHPDLHLTEEEKNTRLVEGRYWVILSGGKQDFTTKWWPYERHQQVIDTLSAFGIRFVQLGGKGSHPSHFHPDLKSTLNLVGKTSLREMIRIIAQSDGVLCTITFAMHAAAALSKPCVVTAGGREEWWWEAYHRDNEGLGPNRHLLPIDHRYLHTIGLLKCCERKGCWLNKSSKDENDKSFCKNSVSGEYSRPVPECHRMITVEKVCESVLSYYADGTLPPLE
jgi:hypothetical protein